MDFLINYYELLGLKNVATDKEIKQAYYKLSFKHHPDKGGDKKMFEIITKSYQILIDRSQREIYDKKSKWGKNYDESSSLFDDFSFKSDTSIYDEEKLTDFIKKDVLNITYYVDEKNFNGNISYDRWIMCSKCDGSGKNFDAKISIKDKSGNIVKWVDSADECDICNGTGKNGLGYACIYCFGKGKISAVPCDKCSGTKRYLIKQEVSGIKFSNEKEFVKIESMGNYSKDIPDHCGSLFVIKKKKD